MSTNSHDIKILNSLISTTIDSADGYAEAAKDSTYPRYTSIFQSRADERRQVVGALQSQVRVLGGTPEDDGTILASMHRMFTNLRSKLSSGDVAVIDEVERGEDHIKSKFEDALKDEEISSSTRTVINDAYESVRKGHDQMRDLKRVEHNNK